MAVRIMVLPRGRARALTVALLGLVLAILAVSRLTAAIELLGDPHEFDYGEAIVYGRAAALVSGMPLYHPLDQAPFTVAAYTPLYYVLAGALQVATGPGFWPGRLLSVASALVTALLIGRVSTRVSGKAWVGYLAAAAFLALGFSSPAPWYAFYRVDMLGVALSMGSVLVLVESTSRTHLVVAGILAAAAFLTKQSLVGSAITGTIWLFGADRRKAAVFATSAVVPAALCVLLVELTTGSFLADILFANVNPFSVASLQGLGMLFLALQAPLLLLTTFYLVSPQPKQGTRARKLLIYYWLITFVSVAGVAKVGADTNYWIEFAAANAILASLGVCAFLAGSASRRQAIAGAVCVNLCVLYVGAIVVGPVMDAFKSGSQFGLQPDAEFDALVERVRAEPREVLAMPQDVVVMARRAILLEPFIYSLFFDAGRWDATPVVRQICDGDVGLVVLAKSLDEPDPTLIGYRFWPAPVWQAMQRGMVLDGMSDGRYVYVPGPNEAARYNPCRT